MPKFPHNFLRLPIASAIFLALASCQGPGGLADKLVGPAPVPAEYTLRKVPTLVMVENFRNPAEDTLEGDQVGRYVEEEIRMHNLAPVVEEVRLYQLRERDPEKFRKMKLPQVGQACFAQQIIYIDLVKSELSPDTTGEYLKGALAVRVRVVDVETGKTAYPQDAAEGRPIGIGSPLIHSSYSNTKQDLSNRMAQQIAVKIGQLFYLWKPDDEVPDDLNSAH